MSGNKPSKEALDFLAFIEKNGYGVAIGVIAHFCIEKRDKDSSNRFWKDRAKRMSIEYIQSIKEDAASLSEQDEAHVA